MVTTNQPTNRVNLGQVRLWNSKKIWLLQKDGELAHFFLETTWTWLRWKHLPPPVSTMSVWLLQCSFQLFFLKMFVFSTFLESVWLRCSFFTPIFTRWVCALRRALSLLCHRAPTWLHTVQSIFSCIPTTFGSMLHCNVSILPGTLRFSNTISTRRCVLFWSHTMWEAFLLYFDATQFVWY